MSNSTEILSLFETLHPHEQRAVFEAIRKTQLIHPLEKQWNISAEFVLEAINRSQDITKRGVRGIIAELAFSRYILDPMSPTWKESVLVGDLAYDAEIKNGETVIKIQTKNQRLIKGVPLRPTQTLIKKNAELADWFIAETQKTRTGKKIKKNEGDSNDEVEEVQTRPYRFGEFDILSVCMQPSTGNWQDFMFCPASTLIPSPKGKDIIATFQPVPGKRCYNWTSSLEECIDWVLNPSKMPYPLKIS